MTAKGHLLTPGQLVNAVAIALNLPAETVVQHDRNLVVAGLRTKGGRGHSAPMVRPLDAARLVVAVLGSARVLDSVETVRTFEQAVYFGGDKDRSFDPAIMRLPDGHNFLEALAELIAEASGPLQVEDPVQFLRRFSELVLSCSSPALEFSESPEIPALQVIATISLTDGLHAASYALNAQATDTLMTYRAYLSRMRREEKNNDRYKRLSRLYGISQRRAAPGTAIMILGQAFRENGLSYETTQEAVAGLLQSAAGKPKKRNAKKAGG